MNKKLMSLLSLLVLLLVISGCGTTASGASSTPQKIFAKIITLEFLQDWGITKAPIDPIEGFTRFLVLIVLFALLFKLAELLKLGKNTAIVIALAVSLITTIFIPGTVLLAAATSYGTIFSMLLLAVPIVLGLFGYFALKEYPWIRVVIMGMLWYVLSQMWRYLLTWKAAATSAYGGIIDAVVNLIGYAVWIVAILFFINLIQAVVGFGSGRTGDALDVKESGKWIYNKFKTGERREKTRLMNEYIEEEKELKLLDAALLAQDQAVETLTKTLRAGKIENIAELNGMVTAVEIVNKELEAAKTEFRRVRGRTWRTERGFNKLVKEFKEKNKDVEQLDILEKKVLAKHDEAIPALNTAINAVDKVLNDIKSFAEGVAKAVKTTPFPLTLKVGSAAITKTKLGQIITALQGVNIKAAEQAQKEALQAVLGIVTEARELMKWK